MKRCISMILLNVFCVLGSSFLNFAQHLGLNFMKCFAKFFGHRSQNNSQGCFAHCVRLPHGSSSIKIKKRRKASFWCPLGSSFLNFARCFGFDFLKHLAKFFGHRSQNNSQGCFAHCVRLPHGSSSIKIKKEA